MTRWSSVLFLLLLFPICHAPASAQVISAPPKVYLALAGSAKDPRQQTLIRSLFDDVRRNLRTSAIVADKVDELPKWSADDAPTLVPNEYSLYVVAYSGETYQSDLGTATMVTFEVGRLEPVDGERKLAFTNTSQELDVIAAPPPLDDGRPAGFVKFISDAWQFRPNSIIASEVTLWIKVTLPELQRRN